MAPSGLSSLSLKSLRTPSSALCHCHLLDSLRQHPLWCRFLSQSPPLLADSCPVTGTQPLGLPTDGSGVQTVACDECRLGWGMDGGSTVRLPAWWWMLASRTPACGFPAWLPHMARLSDQRLTCLGTRLSLSSFLNTLSPFLLAFPSPGTLFPCLPS